MNSIGFFEVLRTRSLLGLVRVLGMILRLSVIITSTLIDLMRMGLDGSLFGNHIGLELVVLEERVFDFPVVGLRPVKWLIISEEVVRVLVW